MPVLWSPLAVTAALLVTFTVSALPPPAPAPPVELLTDLPPVLKVRPPANPPLPPPPPTDWARMPMVPAALTVIWPELSTVTLPLFEPAPPLPPVVFVVASPLRASEPPTANPPLPPPPPIDCATMPLENRPKVSIEARFVTLTSPPAPPPEPVPPTALV